ncbi:MAG TPA: nitroreductase family deazaflavin-dependent oxidoreductase [Candidatus Limnocylindrales bacterium]|nr:nitroreductase family deazaflavin-dependent oxidoreductase [Candidatus Limnocylindrales bacterium]
MRVDLLAASLVEDGRALRLETHGRATGRPASATLGFVREPDGSLLVAAGDPEAAWAANLDADPSCQVTIATATGEYEAELLAGTDRAHAIRELILRGGTPAERLGSGPAYRLRPRTRGRDD